MPSVLAAFGLAAAVLMISALVSRVVERAPFSFPMVFLALGILLGPKAVGLISLQPEDPEIEVIAILSLALVLFLDALQLRFDEVGRHWVIPILVLGPVTLLTFALIALAAWVLLDATPISALLFGAILASTDAVVLRDVIADSRIPGAIRQALAVEAGTNDIVVLPAVLVLAAIATGSMGGAESWLSFLVELLVLGPVVGFAVGGLGAWTMARVDARLNISRIYQSLYGLGLVLAAYALGEAAGGSGFVAAFAAGAAVSILDVELCDCFVEYGEITAEMAMSVSFIFFGVLLSELVPTIALGPALAFALLVIFVARPVAVGIVMQRAIASREARAIIGWFGPRGLSSLLLALLVVQSGVSEGSMIFAVVGLVVVLSVVLHGASVAPVASWYRGHVVRQTLPEERGATAAELFLPDATDAPRITAAQLAALREGPNPPLIVDVRTRSEYARDPVRIPGSMRVQPDEIRAWGRSQPRDRMIVTYCT